MKPDSKSRERSGDFVQSLERGFTVVRAFGVNRPSMTLSEVAREAGLSRAAARRFLHTLVELGYMGIEGNRFHLLPKLLELGYTYLSALGLPGVVQPHLRRLADATGESTSIAVVDEFDIVYVARLTAYRIMSIAIDVGTRFPALATSMGRVIIAFGSIEYQNSLLEKAELSARTEYTITEPDELRAALSVVRAQGWALVDQELEVGLRSVAAPIRDTTGEVVAAVNVSVPAPRLSLDETQRLLVPLVCQAATEIENDLQRIGMRVL